MEKISRKAQTSGWFNSGEIYQGTSQLTPITSSHHGSLPPPQSDLFKLLDDLAHPLPVLVLVVVHHLLEQDISRLYGIWALGNHP